MEVKLLVKKQSGVFPVSPRAGTPASGLLRVSRTRVDGTKTFLTQEARRCCTVLHRDTAPFSWWAQESSHLAGVAGECSATLRLCEELPRHRPGVSERTEAPREARYLLSPDHTG